MHAKTIAPADVPPAKIAVFPTDVAARALRGTLRAAVDHARDVMLYTSTSKL